MNKWNSVKKEETLISGVVYFYDGVKANFKGKS